MSDFPGVWRQSPAMLTHFQPVAFRGSCQLDDGNGELGAFPRQDQLTHGEVILLPDQHGEWVWPAKKCKRLRS